MILAQFFNGIQYFFRSILGIVALSLYMLNIIVSFIIIVNISLLKFISFNFFQNYWNQLIDQLIVYWVKINTIIQKITIPNTHYIIYSKGEVFSKILQSNAWYLLISNHQSWVDILVLQRVFNNHIPPLKFFLKRELLWTLPFVSWVCWLLGFPLVRRYTRKQLTERPELKMRNLAIARQSCEQFKQFPTTVANFVEGSRFSVEKHKIKTSVYKHLLPPQSGGIALSLATLEQRLDKILNVTLIYDTKKFNLWDFVCGRISKISVYIEPLAITSNLIGDYQHDHAFRVSIQSWLNNLWMEKDRLMQGNFSHSDWKKSTA